jgi:VanZ family protein
MSAARHRTLLPHALAVIYGIAIVYASLEPFAPWIAPPPDTPFWPFAPWPLRFTRADLVINVVAYVPFGLFVALLPRRATPRARSAIAFAAGLTLSFAMETLQMFEPPRDASLVDLAATTCGALLGGIAGGSLVRAEAARRALTAARLRVFLPGRLGDVGLALIALWLVAQMNPGIPLFAVTFDAERPPVGAVQLVPAPDSALAFIEASESALQVIGVGIFLTLLLRERRHIGAAVLLLVGAALLAKGIAAYHVLKPAVWDSWLKPGVSFGMAAGLMVLLFAVFLPRPVQIAMCGTALLASLLIPALAIDLPRAPLTIFNWRYGHLLNFNGLTQTVLLVWPIAAAAWLFALAGRPRWGRPE